MGRMFKAILVLLLAAVLGTLVYAYFGDMTAEPVEMRSPVALPDLAPVPTAPPVSTGTVSPASPASPAPEAAAQPAPAAEAAGAGLDD